MEADAAIAPPTYRHETQVTATADAHCVVFLTVGTKVFALRADQAMQRLARRLRRRGAEVVSYLS